MTRELPGLDTRLAKALSHPLRRRLLMAYTGRVVSPSQVATELGEPLGDVSYHTKRLLANGFVELVKAARGRGGLKHYYRATIQYEVADADWTVLSPGLRRRLAEPLVARVVDDVAEAAATGGLTADGVHLSRTRLALDGQGWQELSVLLEALVGEALRIQRESDERIGGEPGGGASALALLHFPTTPRG